jgi:ATP-dependent helicase/nuclease subunit B
MLADTPAHRPRIYTIDATEPFLETLARALMEGQFPGVNVAGPLDLANLTLYLPTRRATRALQDAFLKTGTARALLLPRVRPISEGDEDASLLSGLANASPDGGVGSFDLAPAVGELERQLVLTQLVLKWSAALRRDQSDAPDAEIMPFAAAGSSTPAQAANLARELARLIDMVETENVSLTGLDTLVDGDYSAHWQQTLDFLQIVTQWWPAHLEELGSLSPTDRRNKLILAEADRLTKAQGTSPTIIAGVTGSIPATVALMRAVAKSPAGSIVLPGLDLDLDEVSWNAITVTDDRGQARHPEHPQFGLKTLLDQLGVARGDVVPLRLQPTSAVAAARMKLISETMRPSATTAQWHTFTANAETAPFIETLKSVHLIEAPSAADEAETIALILREVAQTPNQTAALVSPDRLLARRVAIRLESWGIKVDDSAGRPFAKTVPGTVLDLTIEAMAQDFAPAALIALLKHPLVRLGREPFVIRRAARALELLAFRGPYLGRGLHGVLAALDKAERDLLPGDIARGTMRPRAVKRLFDEDRLAAQHLVEALEDAVAPLAALFVDRQPQALATLAAAHAHVAEALCVEYRAPDAEPQDATQPIGGEPRVSPPSPLWQGEAGRTAQQLFEALMQGSGPAPEIAARDYPDFYRTLIATENVRPRVPVHPRLSIWGPFEARLQQTDLVILGSLNDGTWPKSADPGPWLNRPMRATLGLPSPELAIGYAAHDFAMLLAAPRVILTRAEKVDGVPTVPSRWLMRFDAVLAGMGLQSTIRTKATGSTYLAWARQRDIPTDRVRIPKPTPRPALNLRPRKLSVSAVETWIANPYAIFAGRILELQALDPIGTEPGPSIRGGIIHEALARFANAYPDALPVDTQAALMSFARDILIEYTGHPRVAAFWLPRFARFAMWFAETEAGRRGEGGRVLAEVSGQTVVGPLDSPFTLTARADRFDISATGIVITDYKTGSPPKDDKVLSQVAPQLPLEAAIAIAGGFPGLPSRTVTALRFIRASGGEPPGEERNVKTDDVAALAKTTLDGLNAHIENFDKLETPYTVTRRAAFSYDYDDFAHLARVAEWSAHHDGEGDES